MFVKKTFYVCSIVLVVITSCNYLRENSLYPGFEDAIDTAKIVVLDGKNKPLPIQINIPEANQSKFNYNEQISEVSFVKLETTKISSIGAIDRLIFGPDRIIVIDERITKSIFIFDTSGKFIKKISTKPIDKKSGLSRFLKAAYDYNRNHIILFDDKEIAFYYFSSSGDFLKREKAFISFADFLNIPGSDSYAYLTMYGVNKHIPKITGNDLAVGKSGTIITKTFLRDTAEVLKIDRNIYNLNNLCFSGQNLFFTPQFSNVSYLITKEEELLPKYQMNLPGESINDMVAKHPNMDINKYLELVNSQKYYGFSGSLLECGNTVYIEIEKGDRLGFFYNKKSKNIIGGNPVTFNTPGKENLVKFFKYPFTSSGKHFVSIITPNYLNQIKSQNADFPHELDDIKPNSNPVLMYFKLKDF
jgi:hypothetical protein